VLMQGGGFQVYNQPTRSGFIIPSVVEQLGRVADFCRERQALSHKSRTVPQVALLLSETSLWERMDRVYSPWGGEFDELEGALHALLELHYSVDILAEHQVQTRLPEFPLVVIPDSGTLSIAFREAVIDYVEKGGSLLLLGEKCARLWLPKARQLKWTWNDGSLRVAIPSVEIHGILVVEQPDLSSHDPG
jgi:hypothetical protein